MSSDEPLQFHRLTGAPLHPSHRAYCRAELCCINFHLMPIAGIDFVAEDKAGKGVPSVSVLAMAF